MNKFLSNIVSIIFLLLIFICVPVLVSAQVGDPGCDPLDPSCPIDGGLGFLLAAGIGYGLKKIYRSPKKEASAL